ncbi:MAG: hypothetical protein GY870_11380 [archaeon]|nr:hypothetical protein [archaeon]
MNSQESKEKVKVENIWSIVFNALALGMGTVSIIMSVLGLSVPIILPAIGIAALGLNGLDSLDL